MLANRKLLSHRQIRTDDLTGASMHHAVMISSTFSDLSSQRQVLMSAADRAKLYAEGMEHNDGGVNASVLENSLDMVRRSHAYVLLIGRRYGQRPVSTKNPKNLSITELEFNEAIRLDKAIKLILLSDDYPTGAGDKNQADIDSLEAFRERAKSKDGNSGEHRIYKVVNNEKDLLLAANNAMRDLAEHLREHAPLPAADPTPSAPSASAFPPTDCTVATRLQTALFKRIDEIRVQGSPDEKRLLSLLPQCTSRAALDAILYEEEGGLRFLERVRHKASDLPKTDSADSLSYSLALMFLVGAERYLQQEIGSRLTTGVLQFAVDSGGARMGGPRNRFCMRSATGFGRNESSG